jgi:hypothetical protein
MIAVNVTQVMTSSKRLEIGAVRAMPAAAASLVIQLSKKCHCG